MIPIHLTESSPATTPMQLRSKKARSPFTCLTDPQVDQGVVLLGVHHMKGGVTRGLLTKDVRSADGWQIGMDVFEHVQVRYRSRWVR